LLPAAAGFAVLENLVSADDAGIVQVKFAAVAGGPEHEGRVAVTSPGDGDRAGRRLILHKAMLRENGGGVGLGDGSCHDANDRSGSCKNVAEEADINCGSWMAV
jgi:hypothetical protein